MRYTSLLEPMSFQPNLWRVSAVAFLLCLTTFSYSQSEPPSAWTKPVHDLVQQVLEKAASPSSVAFDVENRSGLAATDVQQIRKAIDDEFRSAKVKVVRMDSALAEVKFILSRNSRGLLWIAQIKQGTTDQVIMIEFADHSGISAENRPALFQLQRALLLSRSTPMLDIAVGDIFTLVLGSEQISLYPRDNPNVTATSSVFIAHSSPWPRDLRGRLFLNGDSFTAYLPGIHCAGMVRPTLTTQCAESDDPWPLLRPGDTVPAAFFSSGRNHFSGVLGGNLASSSVPPFFSATRLGDSDGALWAFSGTDGSTRLYIRMGEPARTVTSLGSDLAAVQSNCGARWQLLVTGEGDETAPDFLQAFELQNLNATVVSEKLAFDGPLLALWSGADTAHATAMVRNLRKESYEAYSVSLTCGR